MMTNPQRVYQGDPLHLYDVLHAGSGARLGRLYATSHEHALDLAKRSHGDSAGGRKNVKVKRTQ